MTTSGYSLIRTLLLSMRRLLGLQDTRFRTRLIPFSATAEKMRLSTEPDRSLQDHEEEGGMRTWYCRMVLSMVFSMLALPGLAAPGKTAKPRAQPLISQVKAASSDLVFTPVSPCRVIDTRKAGGLFGAGE